MRRRSAVLALLVFLLLGAPTLRGQGVLTGATWIWAAGNDADLAYFRKTFDLKDIPEFAELRLAVDNEFEAWVNGQFVTSGQEWTDLSRASIREHLRIGRNVLAVAARNRGGPRGLIGEIQLGTRPGVPLVSSDPTWMATIQPQPSGWIESDDSPSDWTAAVALAPFGEGPWGRQVRTAPFRRELVTRSGFRVEEAASAPGSIIGMAHGPSAEIFVAVEGGGIWRLPRGPDGRSFLRRAELFTDRVRNAMGLLWHQGELFVTGSGPDGLGLYALTSSDSIRTLGRFEGGGEHGPHGIVLGPDGLLYITLGNHCRALVEPSIKSSLAVTELSTGHPLPPLNDPRGHAVGIKPPGGTIWAVDSSGSSWRLIAGGFRNVYDLAFDDRQRLFAYDSDMEWDIGLPWYRACHFVQVHPGADYGWRTGSAKWPTWYPDARAPLLSAGRGSPTGMVFYDGPKVPKAFAGTILGGDWAQGRILAFRVSQGASGAVATMEVLVSGQPLNVTDLLLDAGGELLFSTGGRGTRGGLFRLVYEGDLSAKAPGTQVSAPQDGGWSLERRRTAPLDSAAELTTAAQKLREEFLRIKDRCGVADHPFLDPLLGPHVWSYALLESLDRTEDLDGRRRAVRMLSRLLSVEEGPLRATMDQARADPLWCVPAALLRRFPTGVTELDHELGLMLGALRPVGASQKLLESLQSEPLAERQIHWAYCLRFLGGQWLRSDLMAFLAWYEQAKSGRGGASYGGYLRAIADDVLRGVAEGVREACASEIQRALNAPAAEKLPIPGAPRSLGSTLAFLENSMGDDRRNAAEGARVYSKSCAPCHAFHEIGAAFAPDLRGVRGRMGVSDLLEAIVLPSKAISDQYRGESVFTKDSDVFSGLLLSESSTEIILLDRLGERHIINKANVDERRADENSPMPEGLLDAYSLEEIADLVFYILQDQPVTPTRESPWKPLFEDGLANFDGKAGAWSLRDGVLSGDARDLPKNSYLISRDTFEDFTVQFEVHVVAGNSGLQFWSRPGNGANSLIGLQADMGQSYWGSLYDEGGRGMLIQSSVVDWEPTLDRGGFNHMVVEARGNLVRIILNGVPTAVFREQQPVGGRFGFQLHQGPHTSILVRRALIRTLN